MNYQLKKRIFTKTNKTMENLKSNEGKGCLIYMVISVIIVFAVLLIKIL